MAQLELTGQSFKSIREHYNMSYYDFNKCIAPIKRNLDKIIGRKKYQNLLPKQVELIIKHMG